MKKSSLFRPVIPGENLVAKSKNYAWHRPPQYPEFDDAYEWFSDEIFGNADRLSNMSILLKSGISALSVTQSLLVQAVATGKISPDMSILIAGPVYKTLTRILEMLKVPHLSGFDTAEEIKIFLERSKSGDFLSGTKSKKLKISKAQREEMERITEEVEAEIPSGGLMGAPTDTEQMEIPMEASETGLVERQDTVEDEA